MENFNELADVILSFHINAVEYENNRYLVVRDKLVEEFYSPYMGQKINKATWELLSINPETATNKVGYLKSLIIELAAFESEKDDFAAYSQFRLVCSKRNIKYIGPPLLDYEKIKIIPNFIDDLKDEVTTRLEIIDELEIAVKRSITGLQPEKATFDLKLPERFVRAVENELKPGELYMTSWDLVGASENIYVLPDTFFTENSPTDKHRTAKQPEKSSLDFERDILNAAGKKIFEKLKHEYSNCKAKRIASMIFALQALSLKEPGKEIGKHLAVALISAFNLKCSDRAITNWNGKYDQPAITPQIEIEKKIIQDFLS